MHLIQAGLTYGHLTSLVLDYVIVLVAVGALAMALVEIMHRATSARMRYHRQAVATAIDRVVASWELEEAGRFREAVAGLEGGRADSVPPAVHEDRFYWVTSKRIYGDLLHLATGCQSEQASKPLERPQPDEQALFALGTADMFARLRPIVDLALATPRRHPELYRLLVRGADLECQLAWMRHAGSTAAAGEPATSLGSTRAELQHLALANLTTLQETIASGWARLCQTRAMLTGLLLMLVLQVLAFHDELFTGADVVFKLVILVAASVPGGFLAPLMRDLLGCLQRALRRR